MDSHGVSPEEFLRIASALPEVELAQHSEEWVGLRVKGKGFGYLSEAKGTAQLKATLAERAAMVGENPEVYGLSWTSGQFGWVEVQLAKVDPEELVEVVTEAWCLTAPRRLAADYEARLGLAPLADGLVEG
ncbi:MmcQ/YjbR family DNA-binding protein [Streptosporangium sp. NPDC051022]|uniref:MmcQ/YjbR family DNA-binding protein n=1 Tax=Streptosporangium sp. NPDC051022 TaxID=3155752 RepID=UPI00342E80FB